MGRRPNEPAITHDDAGNRRKTIRIEHVNALRLACGECGQEDEVPYSPFMSWAHRLGWQPNYDEWLCPRCAFMRRRPVLPASALVRVRPGAERARKWWDRYCDGETYEDIAHDAGVTRERVRQVLTKHYGTGLLRLARFRLAARRRLLAYVEAPGHRPVLCVVCGEPRKTHAAKNDAAYSFCSSHQWVRNHVMYVLDEHRRENHRNFPSQRQPRKTDKKWPEHRRRRWLTRGSAFHALCTEAYEKQWPLFDRLPPEIREQLEGEADV